MTGIQRAARRLIKQHGSLRKAANATGIKAPYLSRLKNGIQGNPGDDILRKLGITRRVSYRQIETESEGLL
jgi:transcriptional regulator with XRE-family HTH domain